MRIDRSITITIVMAVALILGACQVDPPLNVALESTLAEVEMAPESTTAEVKTVDVEFITFIQADLPEQDVFVESHDNPEQVMRVKGAYVHTPAIQAQPVYASAVQTEHDLLELGANPLGPFPKGESLGFTLYEWLTGTGSGTYTLDGNQATLEVSFQNLVPDGVYTVRCGLFTAQAGFAVVDLPCGAVDGSHNGFQVDAQGNATFSLTMSALPANTGETFSDFAVAYHSDDQSHGISPGGFGLNSHVQLFISAPPPAPCCSPE